MYSTIIDTENDGADADDEVLSETFTDGAGRVRLARVPHTFSSGNTATWAGTVTEYDILGRVYRRSVPTEVNSSWQATGDDATRGFLWTLEKYDWMNRVVRKINTDGSDSPTLNDSDVLISYEGCGCAGATVTTIEGELVPRTDTTGNARRKQKAYTDILGRTFKAETFEWDGTSVYSTIVNTYNGRDRVTLSRQYAGSTSSTTYQDTTATFDGHGRLATSHKPEQRDNSDNLKYTTYAYNPDSSVATVTDGRGAVTAYTYNSRGLVTNIAWTVPGGSGIPDPADVEFAYDNAGNRTSMIDGMGEVDYEYNSLSQLTAESRDFNDTLADEPSSGVFRLEYTYHIGGGLKSYTDPYGDQISYTQDKTGRLSSVTGTSFGGVTSYASNPGYRAWGAVKHLEYGNGLNLDATFNGRLQAETFEIKHPTDTSKKVFSKEYDYYKDGRLKFIKENFEQTYKKFDRLYTYDHQARIHEAKSGTEATGTEQTELLLLPYRQTYQHNAFGQMTERESTLWTEEDWSFHDTYVNNRRTGWSYDDHGRATNDGDVNFKYDANNRLVETWRGLSFETTISRDGIAKEGKRSQRKWNSQASDWDEWETNYFIYSSVFGATLTEADAIGKKKRTFVLSGGSVIARQYIDHQQAEAVSWEHADASGQSIRMSGASGTAAGADVGSAEMDVLGNNVGIHGSLQDPRNSAGDISPANRSAATPEVPCHVGGVIGGCMIVGMLQDGTFASWGSNLPIQMTGNVARHGADYTGPFYFAFYGNSLQAVVDSGTYVWEGGGDDGGQDSCDANGCPDVVITTARPQWLVFVPPIDVKSEAAVSSAIAEAERVLTGKCKDAIEKLLRDAALLNARAAGPDYDNLSASDKALVDDTIEKEFSAAKLIAAVNGASKVYKPDDLNLHSKDSHTGASVSRPGGVVTITFYAGFFSVVNSGKSDININDRNNSAKAYVQGPTTLQQRAFTIIHEAIHALDPGMRDGFLGRIIKKKKNDLSLEEGSRAINDFISANCK